jgi:hypothetical protein
MVICNGDLMVIKWDYNGGYNGDHICDLMVI